MIIIKSMSRRTASFSQLFHYVNKGRVKGDEYCFKHNIYANRPEGIIREYLANNRILKKRKNGVALYHEVISLKHQKGYSNEELRAILKDLAEQYTKARANNCLVYGVVHEQHNQVHCHLMISSNEYDSVKPHYFSDKKFEEIKNGLREYAYGKYTKLERLEAVKNKARAKSKTVDRETQLKKRTGITTEREKVKSWLASIFESSKSQTAFIRNLQRKGFEIYQRGQTYGFIDKTTNKKYRLKTLELESEFEKMLENFETEKDRFKDDFRETIDQTLKRSQTFEEFLSRLDEQHIKIYKQGDTFGFINIKDNRKYRLPSLGLDDEFRTFFDKAVKDKNIDQKVSDFGKRMKHEFFNDLEHLFTGKKPEMEDEIWTQENAGQMEKDSSQEYYKEYGQAKHLSDNEAEKALFRKQMQKARETNEKANQKTHDFSKK